MQYQHVLYAKAGRVAEITINRPMLLNALHPDADSELVSVWRDFEADPDLRVAILTGAGDRAFCTGFDMKWGNEHGLTDARHIAFGGLAARPGDDPPPVVTKTIIAAVNGLAIGGGMELALSCDLIIAADDAEFGLAEVRWGLIPLAGGVHWLPRQIPLKTALGLLLTGDRLIARRAYDLGLVNEVVPKSQAVAVARKWADRIAANGPLAVRAIKQAVYDGLGLPYGAAQHRNYSLWDRCIQSNEGAVGMRAFVEKRAPEWG